MKISFPLLAGIVARFRKAVRFQKEAALLPGGNPVFGFDVVTGCPNVPSEILIPRNAWADKAALRRHREKARRPVQQKLRDLHCRRERRGEGHGTHRLAKR